MDLINLLHKLSRIPGISGHEGEVRTQLLDELSSFIDEVRTDPLGNLILFKRGEGPGPRPKVLLAAHMDEIGLMVTKIEKGGFLRFTTIGGIDLRTLPGQEVVIHGRRPLPGIIGAKPPHLQEPAERKKAFSPEEFYIDTGYKDSEIERWVSLGDVITIDQEIVELTNERFSGKALDNRAGVAVMAGCLKELKGVRHLADIYAVATVQEEVGVRGALVAAYGIEPDMALVIDVCHGDIPGIPEDEGFPLEKGPAIGFGPHVHPQLFRALQRRAKELNITYQVEPSPTPGGTDAFSIQIAREGVATALISLPLRYMHTSVETVALKDMEEGIRLIAGFLHRLEPAFVEGLKCF